MRASPSTQRLVTLAVLLGLTAACGPTGVEVTPAASPRPSKKPSTKPKGSPSPSPSAAASAKASPSPSASATKSPSPSPTATATTSAAPLASPTATASGSAPPAGDWSGTPTEAEALAHIGFPFEPVGRAWTFEAELKVMGLPLKGTMVETVTAVDATKATVKLAFDIAGKQQEQSQDQKRTGTNSSTAPKYTKERVTVPAGTFDAILVEETIEGLPSKTWYDKTQGPVQAIFETKELGPVTVKLKSFKAS